MTSLRVQAISGAKWTTASNVVVAVVQLLQLSVLARILSPEDFGLMGMVTIVLGLAYAFTDGGISNAIVQRQGITRAELSTLYTLNLLAGLLVAALVVACAPLVSAFFKEPELRSLLHWVALIFVVTAVGQQFQALLQKELDFGRLARIEISAVLGGGVTAVSAALAGFGVLSLVWGQLATATLRSSMLVAGGWSRWRPRPRFRWSEARRFTAFGVFQMGERSVNYLSANVDYVLIGRFLGSDVLGLYTLAYRLAVVPLTLVNPILTKVAFPIFARVQGSDAALRQGFLTVSRILAFVVAPLLAGLAASAPVLLPVIFGAKWEAAVPVVQILALLGLLKAMVNPVGSVLLAKGRAGVGFAWNAVVLISNALVLGIAVQGGLYAVAWAYAGLTTVHFLCWGVMIYREIGVTPTAYMRSVAPTLLRSFAMGAVVYLSFLALTPVVGSGVVLLVGLILTGVVSYAVFSGYTTPGRLRRLPGLVVGMEHGA